MLPLPLPQCERAGSYHVQLVALDGLRGREQARHQVVVKARTPSGCGPANLLQHDRTKQKKEKKRKEKA